MENGIFSNSLSSKSAVVNDDLTLNPECFFQQLCSLFPGRLGQARARRLLLSLGGDVDVALAVLMDEDAE